MQKELGPKGFEVLEGAINPDANLPIFMQMFHPTFPVGMASQMGALQYMEISPLIRTFVPYIAFIDREGVIRRQLTGGDLSDETQERTLKEIALSLLNEGATAKGKSKGKRSSR